MESVARPEGAGKSASPTDPHARKGRSKKTGRNFVQPTHDQLAYPMTRRGTSPDDGHLSPLEKLLLIAMETRAWRHGGLCKMTNRELAEAMGLEGPNRVRYVKYLLNGRKRGGKNCPGVLDRGFAKSIPDRDPKNPAGRILVRLAKWVEYQKDHPEIRVWTEDSRASGNSEHTTTEGVGPGPLEGGPGPTEGVGPGPPPSFEQFERPLEDSKTFNVVGSSGQENLEDHPDSRSPAVIAGSFPPAPSVNLADPTAEMVEAFHRWAGDPNNPCRDLALVALDRLGIPPNGPLPAPLERSIDKADAVAGFAAELAARGEKPTADALAEVLGDRYVRSSRDVQAGRVIQKLWERSWRLKLQPDGTIKASPPAGATEDLSEAEKGMIRWLKPELVDFLEADEKAKAKPGPVEAVEGKLAPRVKGQAEIRNLIGQVSGAPDDGLSRNLAARLAGPTAFNDSDRETSKATYFGLLEDVRLGRGKVTEGILQDAFEAACGKSPRKRGAVFIDQVKAGIGGRYAGGYRQ